MPLVTGTVGSGLPLAPRGSLSAGSQLPIGMKRGRGTSSASGSAAAARVTVPEWQLSEINTRSHAGRAGGEERVNLVVDQCSAAGLHVVGAERLVEAVELVAIGVGHVGAVTRVGDDDQVAVACAADHALEAGDHRGLGRFAVDQLADREAAAAELGSPVVGVVDATREIHVGARDSC